MQNPIFDTKNGNGSFPYSTDMLSIFRKGTSRKRTIEPGMAPEELSDIISDRLIEIVKRDLKLEPEDKKEIKTEKAGA